MIQLPMHRRDSLDEVRWRGDYCVVTDGVIMICPACGMSIHLSKEHHSVECFNPLTIAPSIKHPPDCHYVIAGGYGG